MNKINITVTNLKTGEKTKKYIKNTFSVTDTKNIICQICLEHILDEDPIWSCDLCRTEMHLKCVQVWSRSILSKENTKWSCPNCRMLFDELPEHYYCYCGKSRDPDSLQGIYNRIPHCCDNICGRISEKRRGAHCIHPCTSRCHPGFCPPCNAFITVYCPCGDKNVLIPCSVYNKNETYITTCQNVCGKKLSCLKHFCQLKCHIGDCLKCELVITVIPCYCGAENKTYLCGEKISSMQFSCNKICGKIYSCNKHYCSQKCHPERCGICPNDPSFVSSCYCGKVNISELLPKPRTLCTDKIPQCTNICGKKLPCRDNFFKMDTLDHFCADKCHPPPCKPCDKNCLAICNYCKSKSRLPCLNVFYEMELIPKCNKICGRNLSCKKHKCRKICCDTPVNLHVCQEICGRMLSCGLHKCNRRCHPNTCAECEYLYTQNVYCRCGNVFVTPPYFCSTPFPICRNKCPTKCIHGHLDGHLCHSLYTSCPPCLALTTRLCINAHRLVANVICSDEIALCSSACNKILPCQHGCQRLCHIGNCFNEDYTECFQTCNKKKESCQHLCKQKCHFPHKCPFFECIELLKIECECGYRVNSLTCIDYQWIKTLEVINNTESYNSNGESEQIIRLPCNDRCIINKRNFSMAKSLGIDVT
ncbi:hypothetical protein HZS_5172, partial [Henneguya salminicola]